MISSLIWMKWPTNVGYAISPLERLFFDVACELAGGDASLVHFAFPDISTGRPRSLPADFANIVALDVDDASPAALGRLDDHLCRTRPQFVLTFDVQPIHPTFRVMRRCGVRTIVSYWGAPISAPRPAWKVALKRLQLWWDRSRADGLVFESQAMADLATGGRGVPRGMIDIVPLGVDLDRFHPQASDYVHREFEIPSERKVVVFSGHCTPRKGIRTLVGAAIDVLVKRRRQDVAFLICGNRGQESDEYERMYAGMGIDRWIRFAGYRTDMLPIFQSAFCGVIPSSGWDSFTLSSVEMAATALPVVASRLQGLAEAVRHGETGLLFEPGNSTALADALESLLDDPTRASALGRQGRARCERELGIHHQRARLTAAIRRRLQ